MAHLRRVFAGMLTENTSDAGTDSSIVLIMNENGIDKLHHTFGDTSQRDQETGQANLYVVNVSLKNIIPDNLNNSSIRVGIRGDDAWRPERFVVWGQRYSDGAIIPLGIETSPNVVISADKNEGPISFPIRRVNLGSASMQINRLLMLMTTSNEGDAGTDSPVVLRITTDRGALVVDFEIPDTPQDEQETGQANLYFVPVLSPFAKNDLSAKSITLTIQGTDAWLPASFYLFGLDDAEGRPESMVPLVHIRTWGFGWMSTDSSEGVSAVTLSLV